MSTCVHQLNSHLRMSHLYMICFRQVKQNIVGKTAIIVEKQNKKVSLPLCIGNFEPRESPVSANINRKIFYRFRKDASIENCVYEHNMRIGCFFT